MPVELKVPTVGESISEVFIGSWLKQEGDSVSLDEALVELETDKATLDIPAPVAGRLIKILKQAGNSAAVGETIAHLEEGAMSQASESTAAKAPPAPPANDPKPTDDKPLTVMPAAQRLLEEHQLEVAKIDASGPGGRLLKEDVQRHIDRQAEASETPAQEPVTPALQQEDIRHDRLEEAVPMSPLRRTIARRLVEAQQTAALLTTFNEADMTAIMQLRNEYRDSFEKQYGIRLGFMSFFVKAAIDALKRIPQLNAEIRDNNIIYKNYYDIAVAVSTQKGLVTPVIRNAERLSFAEIEQTIADFGKRAQANKLSPEELTGGTFTISNGGVFGSLMSTPIVNPPQSGVLGMHSIQERPVAREGQVVIRPMMYLALSYDHRIVDGREAVTFLKRIKEGVEAPTRLLLEV